MDDAFLASLRCPIDPDRAALLTRDRDQLTCDRCAVKFPIKNGIPVLVSDEAELPEGCASRHRLPCRTAKDRD